MTNHKEVYRGHTLEVGVSGDSVTGFQIRKLTLQSDTRGYFISDRPIHGFFQTEGAAFSKAFEQMRDTVDRLINR